MDHADRDIEPPAHPARVPVDRAVAGVGEVHRVEQLLRRATSRRAREAEQAALHDELAAAAHPGSEPPGWATYPMRRRTCSGSLRRHAHDPGLAAGRQEERRQDPEGRGLAGSVGAQAAEDRAGADTELDPGDGLDLGLLAEGPPQVARLDDELTHGDRRPGPRRRCRGRRCR